MLNVRKLLARRTSISHEHGRLLVRIAHRNDRAGYFWVLLAVTAVYVAYCYMAVQAFLRHQARTLSLLLLGVILSVWYLVVALNSLWGAFGEEEILVANGVMRWTHKALFWKHESEIPAHEISEIEAITSRLASNNHVEFTADRRRYKIGQRLLRDEANEITHELKRAVGLHLRATNSGNV